MPVPLSTKDRSDGEAVPAQSSSVLKHRELNDAVFKLAARQSLARDTLERVAVLVEIAEGLVLCLKRGLETADLPDSAGRQNECYGLPLASLGLGHDPDIAGHMVRLCRCERASDQCPPDALTRLKRWPCR